MQYLLILVLITTALSCSTDHTPYPYITNLPADFNSEQPSPLLIFLHGSGERGEDIEKVKVHGPPKLAANDSRSFPAILISPLCPKDVSWNVDRLEATLSEVKSKYNIDASRIYLTGLSMGGYGTMAWAYQHPEHFAALAPICGGTVNEKRTEAIKSIPLWAFHGAKDQVVPIDKTNEYIASLRAAGADPKYTIYPEAYHDSWTETYDNPELWEWMFAQKR